MMLDRRQCWRVENWHRADALSGYSVVRGPRTAREIDHTYAAVDPAAVGALDRAYAMAKARRGLCGLIDLGAVEPEQQTVTVE
jgi:hypothetical protein